MKIDDNVVLSYTNLMSQIEEKHDGVAGYPDGVIECPSPMRNMRPWRPRPSGGSSTVMGKWSVKTYEMDRRYGTVKVSYCTVSQLCLEK